MTSQRLRLYDNILTDQIQRHRQMAFITGPRQVGKTTTCRNVGEKYLNWDNQDDRNILLAGPAETARQLGLDRLPPWNLYLICWRKFVILKFLSSICLVLSEIQSTNRS